LTGICSGLMSSPDGITPDSPEATTAVFMLVFSVTMFFVGLIGIIVVSVGNRRRAKTSNNVSNVTKNNKPKRKALNIVLLCFSAVMVLVGIIVLTVPGASDNPTESLPPTIIFGIIGFYNLIRVIFGRNSNTNTDSAYPAYQNAAPATASSFNFTGGIPKHLLIDEKSQVWCIPDGRNGELINPRIHTYDDIISFELDTTEELITKSKKGIGRAVAGGALFGPSGAIVGAATGKHKATTQTKKSILGVKIIVNDLSNPTEYISLLQSPIGTGTKIMSMLTVMQNTAQKQANAADQ